MISTLCKIAGTLTLLCILLMQGTEVRAQYPESVQREIDSLQNVLLSSIPDTQKVGIYIRVGELYGISKADTVIALNTKALTIIEKVLKEYPTGTNEHERFSLLKATALSNRGMCYKTLGYIVEALENLHSALYIDEIQGDNMRVSYTLTNLAAVYIIQGDYEQSIEFFKLAIEKQEASGEKQNLGDGYWNLANTYMTIHDTSNYYAMLAKSATSYEEQGDEYGIAAAQHVYGTTTKTRLNYDSSIYHFKIALRHYENLNFQQFVCWAHWQIAENYLHKGNMELCRLYADSALVISQKLSFPQEISMMANLLFRTYKAQSNWESALEMYELHITMSDSINNESTQKATIRQQTQHEFEKARLVREQRDKEVIRIEDEQMARRDNLQYSIVLICLLVIGGLVAMLGKLSLPVRIAEGLVFFAFLIFFEFMLVLADPAIEAWSGGAPGIKLLFNAGIAALIFPLHTFFESKLKGRMVRRG